MDDIFKTWSWRGWLLMINIWNPIYHFVAGFSYTFMPRYNMVGVSVSLGFMDVSLEWMKWNKEQKREGERNESV